jgi:transcriptional regulator with GAF, ATPase, and Fis domain
MSAPLHVSLVVAHGPDAGASLLLPPDRPCTIGRAADADLVLRDAGVADRHLEVTARHGAGVEVWVRALDPAHGALYQGARIGHVCVPHGAVLTLGDTILRLDVSEPAAATDGGGDLPPSNATRFGQLSGRSLRMRRVFAVLERVATSDAALLVVGETGTGKELCAQALHAASPRAAGPLVVCDLSAITPSLIESELFGHVKGAFTSAHRDHEGAFVRARGGTLFLDEIGELDPSLQPRLLRALESRQVKPVGGETFLNVDVRVVAATSRDLGAEVRAGRFRADLFHRLAVVRVELPPLRERAEDLPLLIDELANGATLAPEALAALFEYPFPGNVRELRNVLVRAHALAGSNAPITPGLLGLEASWPERMAASSDAPATPVSPGSPVSSATLLPPGRPLARYRAAKDLFERQYIEELLRRAGGNVSRAAREGGLDRVHLHRLIRKHRSAQ